jgi:hypothetical protein
MADEIVIPIRGADEDLQKALADAMEGIEKFGSGVEKEGERAAKSFKRAEDGASNLGKVSASSAAVAGAAFAATTIAVNALAKAVQSAVSSITEFASSSMFASIEWRRDLADFADSLNLAGDAAVTTADRAKVFAQAIGDATRFTREQALESQRVLANFGSISAQSFERTALAAADLATAMRQDLGSAAEQLGRALERPEQAAAMLRRANVFLSESQQELIEHFMAFGDIASAQEVILGQVESSTRGLARQVTENDSAFDRWGDAVKAASESMGDSLLPVLDKLTPLIEASIHNIGWLSDTFVSFANAVGQSGGFIDRAVQGIVDAHEWMMETIASVAAAAQAAWQHTDQAFEFAFSSMTATMVGWWEDTKHLFTSTVPTVLRWFADNWRDIFTDIANIVQTIATNVMENMRRMIENIVAFLHGDPQRFKFVSLTEGFESTLRELPQIANRELTELEIFWQQRAAKSGDILASAYHDNLQGMREMFGLVRREAEDLGELALDGLGGARAPSLSRRGTGAGDQQEAGSAITGSIEGMEALFNRIQSSAAGERPDDRQLNAIHDGNQKLVDVARGIHELARRDPVRPLEEGNQLARQQLAAMQAVSQAIHRIRPSQPGLLAE